MSTSLELIFDKKNKLINSISLEIGFLRLMALLAISISAVTFFLFMYFYTSTTRYVDSYWIYIDLGTSIFALIESFVLLYMDHYLWERDREQLSIETPKV